ncbi:hypothetical protein HOL24_00980 [bacterium]|nr:hypothetical protein [bacterium]
MHRILHRINTKEALLKVPVEFGVEVDIRTRGSQLIMHHDPFEKGEGFEDWLQVYKHGTLILNVKEEGLENCLIDLMVKYNIDNYFFLDQSFPFLIKTAKSNERRCAVRVSEFEHIKTAMTLSGKIDWVWIDCFTHFPLTNEDARRLQVDGGFKLCFVSPELQGRTSLNGIKKYIEAIKSLGIKGDAVCTKHPDLWA